MGENKLVRKNLCVNFDHWIHFRQLVEFCYDVREWLNSDPENIVAMHCKGGKGTDVFSVFRKLLYTAKKRINLFTVDKEKLNNVMSMIVKNIEPASSPGSFGYRASVSGKCQPDKGKRLHFSFSIH